MKHKCKKFKKENKQSGITLVALVVTIVVLLILAGISITLVLDNNGIIKKSGEGRDKYSNASANEQEQLDTADNDMDKILGIDKSEFGKIKSAGNYVEENKTVKDKNGDTVVIPKGFKVAEDSGSSVIEGVVIEDDDMFNGRGNQYVWVPVTKDTNGDATTPYSDSGTLSNGKEIQLGRWRCLNGQNILFTGTITSFDYDQIMPGTVSWVSRDEMEEGDTFKISVADNGGYYIARYEASYGTDGKANSRISIENSDTKEELKKGTLWNYISRTDAISACENLYVEINSYLINGYAWDTAIIYIQECSNSSDYSGECTKNTVLMNTGTIGDEQCNINDMAGNLAEWTTEKVAYGVNCQLSGAFLRGGRFTKEYYGASYRAQSGSGWENPDGEYNDAGFRAILYI